MNNQHHNLEGTEYCARICQTEIALEPNSSVTDLYNSVAYIDQEKIDQNALHIINIPQKPKRRSKLQVSKFGLTDYSRTAELLNVRKELLKTENSDKKIKTEEISCQTDLMIAPHLLKHEEKAVITMNSSCQTSLTCSPLVAYTNYEEWYQKATELLTEIPCDVLTIPPPVGEPVREPVYLNLKTSPMSCSAENTEWDVDFTDFTNTETTCNICDFSEDILFCRSNFSLLSEIGIEEDVHTETDFSTN